jgi:hypothetical protein
MQEERSNSCNWHYPDKSLDDCMVCSKVVNCEFIKLKCLEEDFDLHKFYRIVTYKEKNDKRD